MEGARAKSREKRASKRERVRVIKAWKGESAKSERG
jgi:hypothetical protein